jgi:hypothetical protein
MFQKTVRPILLMAVIHGNDFQPIHFDSSQGAAPLYRWPRLLFDMVSKEMHTCLYL